MTKMSTHSLGFVLVSTLGLLALGGCQRKPEPTQAPVAESPPAISAPALAKKLPQRQSGLWQTTISEMGSEETPQVFEICIDAQTDQHLGILGNDLSGDKCTKTVSQSPDGSWDVLAACQMGSGGTNEFSGTISGDFSKDYSLRVRSQTAGASLPQMNRVTTYTVKSKRIGACKEGQVGGDLVGEGISFNLFSIAGIAHGEDAPKK
jgi:hypothetical protein